MKKSAISVLLYISLLSSPASHAMTEWKSGFINRIYIDASDIVFRIGPKDSGPCGSNLYHVQRINKNFNEYYQMLLTAIANKKSIGTRVVDCNDTRNITDYGYINYR